MNLRPCLLAAVLLACLQHCAAAAAASADATALLALKSAVSNPAELASWTGASACDWQGVTCNAGHVVSLELGGLGLQGTLPAILAAMDHLQLVSAGGNAFSGALPVAWSVAGAFPQLVSLDLNGSALAGPLPEAWGAADVLPSLQSLVLDGNQLSGSLPQSWGVAGSFSVATKLSLQNNSLTGPLPPTWCNDATSLPALQTLQLDGNSLSGSIPGFWGGTGCQQMRTLTLSDNKLNGSLPADWAGKGYWPVLQDLQLQDNDLSGEFPAQWTAPTAFPAMRSGGAGIVLQPGNAQLEGSVPPYAKVQILAASTNGNGTTSVITSLTDTAPAPAPAAEAPVPVPLPAPAAAPSPGTAAPWTVQAAVRLTGQGLWPFTSLQRAAFKSALVAALGAADANVTASQVTIGTSQVATDSVSQFSSTKPGRRRLLQNSTQAIQVPVYVLTTAGKAAAVSKTLSKVIQSSGFLQQLKTAGFDLNAVDLGATSSDAGDSVPPPGPASDYTAQAPAAAPQSGGGGGKTNVGAIVGGVIGGLVGLLLIGLGAWAWARRRRNRQGQYITQRIFMPRPANFGASSAEPGVPYRKTGLATVQEGCGSPKGSPMADVISQHSSSGSPRGRLTQGLYRSSSMGGSQDLDLLGGRGARSSSFNEAHASPFSPFSPTGASPSVTGGSTPLTQGAVAQHTHMLEAREQSWSSRFSRTFAG